MARGQGFRAGVLEAGVRARPAHRRSEAPRRSWTGCCATPCASIWLSDVPLGVWSSGGLDSSTMVHYAAGAGARTAEDVFRFLPRPQVRREPRISARSRERYGTDHHEFDLNPDAGLRGRDRGVRLLFRRAQRGRGRAAGVVPFEDVPAGSDGGAFRRRRRRVVRRLHHLSGGPLCAEVAHAADVAAPLGRPRGRATPRVGRENRAGLQDHAHAARLGAWTRWRRTISGTARFRRVRGGCC